LLLFAERENFLQREHLNGARLIDCHFVKAEMPKRNAAKEIIFCLKIILFFTASPNAGH
jgi:hypothetical protein